MEEMMNNEVIVNEVSEEVEDVVMAADKSSLGGLMKLGVAAVVVGGGFALYKYAIKPMIKKHQENKASAVNENETEEEIVEIPVEEIDSEE